VADAGGQFVNISRGRFEANYANGNEASTGNAWGGAFASFCPGNGWSSASEINFGGESLVAIGHDDGPPLCNNMATLGKGNGYGGAISVTNGSYLSLRDRIRIEDNKADMGGGLYFSTEDNSSASAGFQLQEAIFQRNSAERGGGIWTEQLGFLKIVEQPFHDQQTWIRNNKASLIGNNIYPVEGVCEVTIDSLAPFVSSCVPEYGNYAVLQGKPFRFYLEAPAGRVAIVVQRGIGRLNPTSVQGNTYAFSFSAGRGVTEAELICTQLISTPLWIESPHAPVFFVGEKVQLSYTPNQFIAPYSADSLLWETTNYGVASISETGLLFAKTPGVAYISAGLMPECNPKVELPEAFLGDVHDKDIMKIYVIDSSEFTLSGYAGAALEHIYYYDTSKIVRVPVLLSDKWEEVAEEYSAIEWKVSDGTVAEFKQVANASGTIRFKKIGHTKLTATFKARPECSVTHDFFVIDTLKLSGITDGQIFTVGSEIPCEVSETGAPDEYGALEWSFSDPAVVRIINDFGNLLYLQMEAFGTTTLTVRLKADPTKSASVSFSVAKLTLNLGDVVRVGDWVIGSANIVPENLAQKAELIWKRTPEDASLSEWHWNDNNVALHALQSGLLTVSVEVKGSPALKDSVRVRVIDDIHIVGLTVFPLGETDTLFVVSTPEMPDAYYTWSSDNEAVVTVGRYDGVIKTLSRGTATITAVCSRNTELLSTHTIQVKDLFIHYDGPTFLPPGATKAFTLPESFDISKVHWHSSNEKIVTVDRNGTITVGDTTGVAIVSVISLEDPLDGSAMQAIQYTIYAVRLELEASDLLLNTPTYFQVQSKPSDVIGSAKDVTWESSSPTVLISEDGCAQAIGKPEQDVIITVSLKANPAVKTTASVKVNPVQRLIIKAPAQGDGSFTYNIGQWYDFDVELLPVDAKSVVRWYSLTPDIVSVDNEGLVNVLDAGTARIRVATPDDRCADTCEFPTVSSDMRVVLSPTILSLHKGATHTLQVGKDPEDFPVDGNPVFSSEKPQVATVDPVTGEIKAIGFGETYITVTFTSVASGKTFTADCRVIVENPLTDISIGKDTFVVDRNGGSVQLPITFIPSDATNKTLDILNDRPEVVTVTSTGRIYPVSDGNATITIQAAYGQITKTCVVKVQTFLRDIRLNTHHLTLKSGITAYSLHTVFEPEDVTVRPSLQWTSGNPAIVSVDETGRLELKSEGTTFIRVAAVGYTFVDTCWVSVVPSFTSLSLDATRLQLNTGRSALIKPEYTPLNMAAGDLQWRTSNAAVATVVSDDGFGRVSARAAGTALITVMTEDGDLSDTCTVTVESLISNIALSRYNLALQRGESHLLRAEITPADAYRQTVTWLSSDASVAEVSASGNVTALKAGTAQITAKTENGFEGTCQVSVTVPIQSLTVITPSFDLYPGQDFALTAELSPKDASAKNVIWTVSDPTILEIRSFDNGKTCYFYAKKSGWVYVQAESSDHRAVDVTYLNVSNGWLLKNADGNQEPIVDAVKPEVSYSGGVLRLANFTGFQVYLTTIHGKICGSFRVSEPEESLPLNLPAGIYILSARNGKEQVTLKFIVH
jgi:uncharacterized protein YjdB